MKVPKDPDVRKFLLNTPVIPEGITFEGPRLAWIPHLKLEDWDLADHERFPKLTMESYMRRVYYKEYGVTMLEPMEWIRGVNQSGLLNLLWVPHYHRSNINLIVIKKLLTLVHDGCFWLSTSILIIDMVIHQITLLPHLGLNSAKDFGGKISECDLVEKRKEKFKLVRKLREYSITSITNLIVQFAT